MSFILPGNMCTAGEVSAGGRTLEALAGQVDADLLAELGIFIIPF